MKLIKIINGTYGFRPQPYVVELKDAGDPPFEVSDEEAARLIDLGVAAIAFGEDSEQLQAAMDGMVDQLEDQPAPPEDPEDEDAEDIAEEPAQSFTREELELLTNPQLAELAEDLGVEVKGRPKKTELVDLILQAAAEDDELPDLGAADPEV